MTISTRKGKPTRPVSDILGEGAARKERKRQTTFYLPESQFKEIKRYCVDHDITMTGFLEELCAEKLKEEKQKGNNKAIKQ